ncbi:MAG: O-antigen ligase family protein [Chromatiaceae bacterium]
MQTSTSSQPDARWDQSPWRDPGTRLSLGTLALLFIVAPLFNGGLDLLPRLLLQWLGLILIGLTLWRPQGAAFRTGEGLFLGALFLAPLLYLIPWPAWVLAYLPGREAYAQAIVTISPSALAAARPISLHPFATETAWLLSLIPIGVYLGTRSLGERGAMTLVYLLFAVAVPQVVIGLFQFATATSGVDYGLAEWVPRGGAASGTFRNRNHLAGMLEMIFPLALALFLFHFGRGPKHHHHHAQGWREKAIAILRAGGRPSLALGLLVLVFVVGIVVTRSRTGIAMAMLGMVLTALLFASHLGGRGAFGLVGRLITLAIGFAAALGLAPVLDRFAVGDMVSDARWPLAAASFDGVGTLLPLGSGPGTYPDAFPIHQPVALGQWFINHAHNDYLEALYETGVWALVLILIFLVLYARQWSRLMTGDEWSSFRSLQIGAGIGLALLLGHAFSDYNLHTPANLAYFAFLAGLFFTPPGRLPLIPHKRRRVRRTRLMPEPHPEPHVQVMPLKDQRPRNPFDAG